ncbi:SpaH/EbpB family LPXTG-anchored major pilin [Ruminococcaceae bacterium OttesenSCG-928-A16]|nr:SpaH/EbpB family LPXTG-anchored major pilin [Ruminococcaceae bacterium OttesenSCG-928-A16]
MRKTAKYLVAALLCLALLLPTATVFAAGEAPLPPNEGTLTIHKYTLANMQDAGANGNGTLLPQMPEGAQPIEGIEFTIWRVDAGDNPLPETAAEAKQYLVQSSAVTVTTGANGTATLSLPRALYYVEETGSEGRLASSANPQSFVPCSPFLVAVPLTSPSGQGWITDVHVYPKNQALMIDKFVNEAGDKDYDFANINAAKYKPVPINQNFGWTIVSSLPAKLGETSGEQYEIQDVLPGHFTFVPGSVKVYSTPALHTACSTAHMLQQGQHYILTFDNATNSLTVQLTQAGIALLQQRYGDVAVNDRFLMIKYDCQLNDTAPYGVSLPTGATVSYTKGGTGLFGGSTPTASVTTSHVAWQPAVHTGQIRVTKVTGLQQNILLAGASFGLAPTQADALAQNFIATGTTGQDGRLIFRGLAYGQPGDRCHENSNNTSYWLVETQPPEGYIALPGATEVTFNYQKDEETGQIYFALLTVHNQPMAEDKQPITSGGQGETGGNTDGNTGTNGKAPKTGDTSRIALAAGLLLVSSAVFMVVWRRKKGQNKPQA